jgi:hypothetical protein
VKCPGCTSGTLNIEPCQVTTTYTDRGYIVTSTHETQVLMCNACEVAVDMRDERARLKQAWRIVAELQEVASV